MAWVTVPFADANSEDTAPMKTTKTTTTDDDSWLLSILRSVTRRPFELSAGGSIGPTIVISGVDNYLWIDLTRIRLRDEAWVRSHLAAFIERNAITNPAPTAPNPKLPTVRRRGKGKKP